VDDVGAERQYDGLWHAEDGQFARDRRRLNLLHAAGWRIVFVTAPDMYQEPQLVRRITAALG
jgi:very-short-patch-repair endonuclease